MSLYRRIAADTKFRFRFFATMVLVIGIASASVLYWVRTRAASVMDDPSMAGYSKPQLMQMEVMYGRMGTMTSDLLEDLKQPGTQAILIAAFSTLFASVCFFLANRWVDEEGDPGKGHD